MRSDVADATSNVAYDIFDTNMWGGGGDCALGNFCFGGIGPPAQDTYLYFTSLNVKLIPHAKETSKSIYVIGQNIIIFKLKFLNLG